MIRVAVCDDHAMVREALARVVASDPGMEIVGTTDSSESTLRLLDEFAVDVLVLDVRLDGESGLALARKVTSQHPGVRIVVLTSFANEGLLVEAHEVGAGAFLLKSGDANGLLRAIRDVAAGKRLINTTDVRAATSSIERSGVAAIRKLDDNDRMIATLIARGYSDKQIAESVYLGLQTVRNRVSRMLSRFDKQNRTQLALMFAEHELELQSSAR